MHYDDGVLMFTIVITLNTNCIAFAAALGQVYWHENNFLLF